jgi:hypothetical protein
MRGTLEGRHANLYVFLQLLEDCILIFMFILGLAMLLSNGYRPNIYAKF